MKIHKGEGMRYGTNKSTTMWQFHTLLLSDIREFKSEKKEDQEIELLYYSILPTPRPPPYLPPFPKISPYRQDSVCGSLGESM